MTRTVSLTLTPADQARSAYFYVPVDVPPGATRIEVVLRYQKADDAIIDLGLFDPRDTGYPSTTGFRGWSGGARDRIFVATDDATPGYVSGPMPPGTWNIVLGLYRVPVDGLAVSLEIDIDAAPRAVPPQPPVEVPTRPGAGWYRGDLHSHTWHSDAAGSPGLLHQAARRAGLDFLAVTDHNTLTHWRYFGANSSPDLVFVRGMEVTTAAGHANVYGLDGWIDFRLRASADAHVLESMVHQRGGLFSINHDKPPMPWAYELPRADAMEVWQSAWMAGNWVSLARYQARLAAGHRLSAIGGSDYHQPATLEPPGPLGLGRPTTVLWLDALSEAAILQAIRVGRGYVTESPAGPHLEIEIDGHPTGSDVVSPTTATAIVRGAEGDRLSWIDASGEIGSHRIESDEWRCDIDIPRTASGFLRAEIVADASTPQLLGAIEGHSPEWRRLMSADDWSAESRRMRRAISNPIYLRNP